MAVVWPDDRVRNSLESSVQWTQPLILLGYKILRLRDSYRSKFYSRRPRRTPRNTHHWTLATLQFTDTSMNTVRWTAVHWHPMVYSSCWSMISNQMNFIKMHSLWESLWEALLSGQCRRFGRSVYHDELPTTSTSKDLLGRIRVVVCGVQERLASS